METNLSVNGQRSTVNGQRSTVNGNKGIRCKAFTLVELVVVIAIIAAVASILLPTIGKIKREVQKVQDVSHLKKIRDAWHTYAYDFGIRVNAYLNGTYWITAFAEYLAGQGQQEKSMIILNDASVYFSPGDKYCCSKPGNLLCGFDGDTISYTGDNWISEDRGLGSDPVFSYGIVTNLPAGVPPETTPFAFTRGLCADGTWHDKYGVYGDTGGYVIYCDGHVKWFDGKRPVRFLKWDQSGYTTDIRQAVPNSTRIMCGNPAVNQNVKNKNNSLMITNHVGTGGAE